MLDSLTTPRLIIDRLSLEDYHFIFELVNTPGWINFIGDRNVTSFDQATAYIQKILDNSEINYWVVKLKDNRTLIGVITFMKREYLQYHDIGFAFLPNYTNQGFAYEAVITVLNNITPTYKHQYVLATTIANNTSSIKLLKKLGLRFIKEIKVDKDKLQVYSVSKNKLKKSQD